MDVVFPLLVLFLGISTYPLAYLGWSQGATGPVTASQWWSIALIGTAVTVVLVVLPVHLAWPLGVAIATEFALTLSAARVFLARPAD